jgi:hypothetical protein
MKFSTNLVCALLAAGCASPVLAAPYGDGNGAPPSAQGQRAAPGQGGQAERSAPRGDMRRAGDANRGQMNSEERRQLRRDIQDAGKDIYRPAPQRHGNGGRQGR